MEHHIEQYQSREGGVTLHTWTEVQGSKKENFSGLPEARFLCGFGPFFARRTSQISPTFHIAHHAFMNKARRTGVSRRASSQLHHFFSPAYWQCNC